MNAVTKAGPAAAAGAGAEHSAGAVLVICALAALGTLATNIFLPSLTAMAADLRVSSAAITASISAFLAIFAVGQLAVGPLSDRFGRRVPVLAGLGLFVLGSLWCALAADLTGLLVGRAIQACGVCAATVLSRAIAADLFAGPALARVMAAITIATAAAPGFSPLAGSALLRLFGWRSEFAVVALFAAGAALAYGVLIGETKGPAGPATPRAIGRAYLRLLNDPRFAAPTRTAGLMMAALFAVFSAAPRVLLERFGVSPTTLGGMFAAVVGVVFVAATLAPRLSARFGPRRAMIVGLGVASVGAGAMLLAVLAAHDALAPFLGAAALFVTGVGLTSPLASAAALSPFNEQAGVAAALFGFTQMAGAACGAGLAAVVSRDPALGLAVVLAAAAPLALLLHARDRSASPRAGSPAV